MQIYSNVSKGSSTDQTRSVREVLALTKEEEETALKGMNRAAGDGGITAVL